MCLKEFGKSEREVDVSIARDQHHAIITNLMVGPGDSEGAMHRAERQYGLPYWAQFNLRYKRRASAPFIDRVRQAYLSMLETSVRRDLDRLKTEQVKGPSNARIEGLIVEAENLLGRIKARSVVEE